MNPSAALVDLGALLHELDGLHFHALKKGMEVKAIEFVKQGAEIYQRG